ncbi:hypothetical protein V1511DRAFT_506370 [Dipodascopsis uninucleata]
MLDSVNDQSIPFNILRPPTQKQRSMRPSSQETTITPLPVQVLPSQIRPLAYRIFSKKHGLNLKASGLDVLAECIGRKFGVEWRSRSEHFLDQVGRRWKDQDKGAFVEGELLKLVIKDVEMRSASFTGSLSRSLCESPALEEENIADNYIPLEFCHIWDAFAQPRWSYNRSRKHFERASTSTIFANARHTVHALNNRYHILHHRLLRNEKFQPPSLHSVEASNWHSITPIKNLLGRYGNSFLILGMLVKGADGNWFAEDPSATIELILDDAICDGAYYVEGFILLFEGVYTSGEKLLVSKLSHPPTESREKSREAYGYLDFMNISGIGSTPDGRFDKIIEQKMISLEQRNYDTRMVFLGGEIHLDDGKVLEALSRVLTVLEQEPPLAIVLCGSFISYPFHMQANGISSVYKGNRDYWCQSIGVQVC